MRAVERDGATWHHRDQLLALRALGDETGRGGRGTSSPRYFAFHNPSTEVTSEIPSRRQTSCACAPASSLLQNPDYPYSPLTRLSVLLVHLDSVVLESVVEYKLLSTQTSRTSDFHRSA
jgi:hypothetical protein